MKIRRPAFSSLNVTWVLLVTLALLNVASLWGIFATRRGARDAAENDLQLRTAVLVHSVETELASLRADFLFLAQAPPLIGLVDAVGQTAGSTRERSRIDAEETLLLFLEAHPEVRRLEVEGDGGRVLLVVGWRREEATVFPPNATPGMSTTWFQGRWPTDPREPAGPGLQAWVDRDRLMAGVVPAEGSLSVMIAPATPSAVEVDDRLKAAATVVDSAWEPPVNWILSAREEEGQLLRSVEAVTGLYGTTVALNVAVMSFGLILGLVAFRNLRRAALLEAEREQQERVRELERQLMHSERLASVGRLAAGLAHEVNNPLEGVSNYLAMLRQDLDAGRTEESHELLELAGEGIHRAADVIRQVLAYSDPGRNATTRLDLAEVLRRSADFLERSPQRQGARIELDLPAKPLLVEGNPVTLGQVFLNLLLNACEAQAGEGVVGVNAEVVDGEVWVRVRDHGPGIEPDDLERVFEPFFSTHNSTGLGLAVSKGIVEAHAGTIEAVNRSGGGAELTVRLPLIT